MGGCVDRIGGLKCVKTLEGVSLTVYQMDLVVIMLSPIVCLCPLRSQLFEHEQEVIGLEMKLDKVGAPEKERERGGGSSQPNEVGYPYMYTDEYVEAQAWQ